MSKVSIECIYIFGSAVVGVELSDRLCSARLISKDIVSLNVELAEQRNGMNGIMVVAGTEHESQWIA